ncbi:DUF6634 family protein [Rhizobium leguminosarum]|uniref:DUF6634 family protein n=1 Tax=Rhizobium leguminosarum TaxID=384 RepID=UPI00103E0C17|nr:DUF6634 family protein [Rhizobium leguminosarum]TCA53034.1 hypothetical protein E0H71_16450 [Rhizobium leguminosarum bv. viciae]TCA68316.1 hypothetical protein E0H69_30665 [Rhizobium leguminosarum bv. viciae]
MFDGDSHHFLCSGSDPASLIARFRQLADDLEDIDKCLAARPRTASLNSWALGQRTVPCLIGRPIGHPIVSDGRTACSSELVYLDPDRGVARTMSRWYRLGTRVDPEYWGERLREEVNPSGSH